MLPLEEINRAKAKAYFKYLCASTIKNSRESRSFQKEGLSDLNKKIFSIDEKSQSLRSTVSSLSSKVRGIEELNSQAMSLSRAKPAAPLQKKGNPDGWKEIMELEKRLEDRMRSGAAPFHSVVSEQRKVNPPDENRKIYELEKKIEEKLKERTKDGKYIRSSVLDDAEKVDMLEKKIKDKLTPDVSPLRERLKKLEGQFSIMKKSKKYDRKSLSRIQKLIGITEERISAIEGKYSKD